MAAEERVKMAKVILIGGTRELTELCEASAVTILGIMDANPAIAALGYSMLEDDASVAAMMAAHPDAKLHITTDKPAVREKLWQHYQGQGASFQTLVHPTAIISPTATVGEGCVIHAGAILSSDSKLGKCVKINTAARVTHNVLIGEYASIAPGVVLCGHSKIAPRAYIGAGAVVLNAMTVGIGAVVGAGAVVTRDVAGGQTVAGNPARELGSRG